MATQPPSTAVPPIEVVTSEVVATLAFAAHGYLSGASEGEPPDLNAAEIAIDLAGSAYERIAPRLSPDERSALAALLTDLRLTFVRKRGP